MMRAPLTIMQVQALVTHLREALGDDLDDQTLLDSLEGETDLFEFAGRLLDKIEYEEGVRVALIEQIQSRNDRKARSEKRAEHLRETVRALMETAGLDKLPLPEATVTLRKVAPKVIVTDVDLLPDALCRITRKPDMTAIKAAQFDEMLPGLALDNGGSSLTIRRK